MSDLEAALGHVKSEVREVGAYTLRHLDAPIKLNQNESPFDAPEELKDRLWRELAARPWNRYPPFVPVELTAAVSEVTGWSHEGVLVGNGSNELIQALLATVIEPGRSVVVPEPTFTLYRLLTRVGGGNVVSVSLEEGLGFDVEAIIAMANREVATAIVLCSPNNPTGSALSREDIERIYEATTSLVVLDQAYVEFGGFDAVPLLRERPRLLILRTFSKAMSMAGLRAGYLLGHPELVREISKAKLPYNINFISEVAAAEVLRSRHLLLPQIQRIRDQRDRIARDLAGFETLQVFPSEANFVLFRVDGDLDHRSVYDRLLQKFGILVRDVSAYPMLDRCLRVTAGSPEETDAFLAAMELVVGRRGH